MRFTALISAFFVSLLMVACNNDGDDNPSGGPGNGSGNGICSVTNPFTPGGAITASVNGIDQLGSWAPEVGGYKEVVLPGTSTTAGNIYFDNFTNVSPQPEVKLQLALTAVGNCQLGQISLDIGNSVYTLNCPTLNNCPGVKLDNSNGQVTLTNASLDNLIVGSPPAIVNGTLTW